MKKNYILFIILVVGLLPLNLSTIGRAYSEINIGGYQLYANVLRETKDLDLFHFDQVTITAKNGYYGNETYNQPYYSIEYINDNTPSYQAFISIGAVYIDKNIASDYSVNDYVYQSRLIFIENSYWYRFYHELIYTGISGGRINLLYRIGRDILISGSYSPAYYYTRTISLPENDSYIIDLISNQSPTKDSINRLNSNYLLTISSYTQNDFFYLNNHYSFSFTAVGTFNFQQQSILTKSNDTTSPYTIIKSRLIACRLFSAQTNLSLESNQNLLNNRVSRIKQDIYRDLSEYWSYSTVALHSYDQLVNFSSNYEYSVLQKSDNITQLNTTTESRTVEFVYNYSMLEVVWIEGRFSYNSHTVDPLTWGNWGVAWNWLRDGLCTIINTLILLLTFLLYIVVVALNYLLWVPLAYIILLVNNYVLFGLAWAVAGLIWVVIFVFLWLWDKVVFPILSFLWTYVLWPALQWIWDQILNFVAWLQNDGGRLLMGWILIVISYVIATVIWLLAVGTIDFNEVQQAIQSFLLSINDLVFLVGRTFLDNFSLFLGYSATYLTMVGLIYLKYIYCKAKGYIQRASRLQSMINVYKLPMVLVIRISQYIIGFIQGGVPKDGLNE